ncbi:class II myosin [Coemansia sp. RSA 485]|nr:class II myosin [Coemansia sp. RSA 485]
MSPYQDNWAIFHLNNKPDLVINCSLKTELLTWLNMYSNGNIKLQVNSTITYNNKKMKPTQIKFVKNENVRGDVFEKKTVQVASGEPANKRSNVIQLPRSTSRPAYKKPQQTARKVSSAANNNSYGQQQPRQQQQQQQQAPAQYKMPQPQHYESQQQQQVAPARKQQAPPPAPPPAPPAPVYPRHKALYDFPPQNPGELGLQAGMIYEIVDKNANGWWLGLREGVEGWIPSNYLSPDPEPEVRRAPMSPVLPKPSNMRNGNGVAAGHQGDSMAQLAAALTSRGGANGMANGGSSTRPAMNRFAQDDSDEEAW